jgi:hypothetical protein
MSHDRQRDLTNVRYQERQHRLTCIMVILLPDGLRSRAKNYRSLALECDDAQLKVALLLLAEEFEREAEDAEAGMARSEPQRAATSPGIDLAH